MFQIKVVFIASIIITMTISVEKVFRLYSIFLTIIWSSLAQTERSLNFLYIADYTMCFYLH